MFQRLNQRLEYKLNQTPALTPRKYQKFRVVEFPETFALVADVKRVPTEIFENLLLIYDLDGIRSRHLLNTNRHHFTKSPHGRGLGAKRSAFSK